MCPAVYHMNSYEQYDINTLLPCELIGALNLILECSLVYWKVALFLRRGWLQDGAGI